MLAAKLGIDLWNTWKNVSCLHESSYPAIGSEPNTSSFVEKINPASSKGPKQA